MAELTLEEKLESVQKLRPIDDLFFEVLARNKAVCEEILRTVLEDPNLCVKKVTPQKSERNIYGKSVRLDALCILGDGERCNIEVQRSDNDNHLKRARFNASIITVFDSNPGENYEQVKTVYVVYISEFDFFKKGRTIYHVENVILETGEPVNDGLHEIFVNAEIDDASNIAELMKCFKQKTINNPLFPNLSKEVNRLKTTEGGTSTMCKVMEDYSQKKLVKTLSEMVTDKVISLKEAAKRSDLSVQEFKKVMAEIQK